MTGIIDRRLRTGLLTGLVVLWALWAFAAFAAGQDAADMFRARALGERVGQPADAVILALQDERRLSTGPRRGDGDPALAAQRVRTDEAHAGLRRSAGSAWARWSAGDDVRGRVDALLGGLRRLPEIRSTVDAGNAVDSNAAAYTQIIDIAFRVYAVPSWDDPQLARDAHALVALSRAREMLAREDALVRGALAAGGLTGAQRTALARLVGARRQLRADAAATLAGEDLQRYRAADARTGALRELEDVLVRPDGAPIAAAAWAAAADPALADLRRVVLADAQAAVRQATPAAAVTIVRAGLVGGLGLVAVIVLSLLGVRHVRTLAGRAGAGAGAGPAAPPGVSAAGPARDVRLPALLLDLNRRNQSLLHRQLRLLDSMERRESSEEGLSDLFRADHLATRIRRNVEKAVTLAGGTPGRRWRRPVPMVDVIRAAAAEVPDYARVAASAVEPAALAGPAVADLIHLLAELIENATSFSPANTRVRVTGERGDDCYAVTVVDSGPGMPADDQATAREVMSDAAPPASGAWWGLYAVGRFADRHGIAVSLSVASTGGLAAQVRIPTSLVVGPAEPDAVGRGAGGPGGEPTHAPDAPGTGRPSRARPRQPVDRVTRLRGRARSTAETMELPVAPAGLDLPGDPPEGERPGRAGP
jgi:signal transduction histidine kinase